MAKYTEQQEAKAKKMLIEGATIAQTACLLGTSIYSTHQWFREVKHLCGKRPGQNQWTVAASKPKPKRPELTPEQREIRARMSHLRWFGGLGSQAW